MMSVKYLNVLVLSLCAGLFSSCVTASDTDEEMEGDSLKRKARTKLINTRDMKRLRDERPTGGCARARSKDTISPEDVHLPDQAKEGLEHMEHYQKATSQETKRFHAERAIKIFDQIIANQENPDTNVLGWAAMNHVRLASQSTQKEKYAQSLKAAQLYDRALAAREEPGPLFTAGVAHAHFQAATFGPEEQKLPHFKEAIRLFNQSLELGTVPAKMYLYAAIAHIQVGKRSPVQEKIGRAQIAERLCENGLRLCPENENMLRQKLSGQLAIIHRALGQYYTVARDTGKETKGDSLKRKAPQLVNTRDTKRQCVEGTVRRPARAKDRISPEDVQPSDQEKEGLMHMELYFKATLDEQKRAHAALAAEIFDRLIEGQENPGTNILGWAASSHFRLASHCAPEEQYAHSLKAAQFYDRALVTREDPDHRFVASAAHAHFKFGMLAPVPQKLPHFQEAIRLFSQSLESGEAPANLYLYTAVAHLEIGKRYPDEQKAISLEDALRACEKGLHACPDTANMLRKNLLRQKGYIYMELGQYCRKAADKIVVKKG